MGIVENVEGKVKEWIFKIAIGKGIKSATKLIVSYCATKGIIFVGTFFGMVIDTGNASTIEAALTLAVNSGLTILRNWLKHKFNVTWL